MKLILIAMLQLLLTIFLFCGLIPTPSYAATQYQFEVSDASFTRLCSKKSILTVNGMFPGPTINATQGETIFVNVTNKANESLTIHWHGVKQPRNPWSDGPEYITQCPIQPGGSFNQRIVLSDEVSTMWWHAHSDWSRATVYGMIIVNPKIEVGYPFSAPDGEIPIIIGEWWKSDIKDVLNEFVASGGDPNNSDAFLINGQPGDLYSCSDQDTFKTSVESGKTYLLRIVNAVMNNIMFFRVANHTLTTVASDAAYVKNFSSDYVAISPGQTLDCLLVADQEASSYYMAARPYAVTGNYDNTTTTGLLEYVNGSTTTTANGTTTLVVPTFPDFNDTTASVNFTGKLRSLADAQNPIDLPVNMTTKLLFTLSINTEDCESNNTCSGPDGERLLASMNNITFEQPNSSILDAYYNNKTVGVYDSDFPSKPPNEFNYTADSVPTIYSTPENGTKVLVLEYNSTVEIVLQGTNTAGAAIDHPMHLHGQSFYVVGSGFGNFNNVTDPANYNLVDPPLLNTIAVPVKGWTAIRFRANNPGVWFMHCHIERHATWGMEMAFITKDGDSSDEKMLPPPADLPVCV